jgi:hypothetical protein
VFASDQTNVFAQTVHISAAPYDILRPLQRITPQLEAYSPGLLKVDAARLAGLQDPGLLYNVIDDATGHSYIYGLLGLNQTVHVLSMNNRADVSPFTIMDMKLGIFEFFRFGMALSNVLVEPVPESIQARESQSMDGLRTHLNGGYQATAPNGFTSLQRTAESSRESQQMLGFLAETEMPVLEGPLAIQLDAALIQKLKLAIAPSFNLDVASASSRVVNYYGDFQFWSNGEEVDEDFVFDVFYEEELEF